MHIQILKLQRKNVSEVLKICLENLEKSEKNMPAQFWQPWVP